MTNRCGQIAPAMPGVTCDREKDHAGGHRGYRDEQDEVVFWDLEPFEPSVGVRLIGAERQRQIEQEGWTPEHDDAHRLGEMLTAAMCYGIHASFQARGQRPPDAITASRWPWEPSWWKPSDDPIRNLAKAGALIAAEIDRLQRSNGGA